MPRLRYLYIRFNNNLFPYEVPCFRAAVIEKTQRVASLFHNHRNDTQVIYRYPLIQYKVTRKKASIVCLQAGTDDIHYLLQKHDLSLRIGEYKQAFEVDSINLHYHQVQTWNKSFTYSLLNWLPLNQKNYSRWHSLQNDIAAQKNMLNNILRANLLAFAKGINWWVEDEIITNILKINNIKPLTFKGRKMMAVSLVFTANVSLPDFIGLGKGASVGFGVVWGIRR